MVSHPDVSVLLPVRDAEDTLAVALRSVARQRHVALECVVVDDGSRDRSAAIASDFARSDPRFRVVRGDREGLVTALERGLDACRADRVARMDADDWMHRDRLHLQAACLDAHPGLAAVGSHVRLMPRPLQGGMGRYESWLNAMRTPDDVARESFVECPLAHPTLMLRRELLRSFRYRDAGWPEDYDLLLRLQAAGHRLGVVPRRLHGWRDGPARLSRTGPAYAPDRFLACKAHFLVQGLLAAHSRYVLWGYGGTGRALRRALLVHGRAPSHIVEVHPGRVGQRIHGAPVIPPESLPALASRRQAAPIVVSVAGEPARRQIREALGKMGLEELRDFVCAA